MRKKECREEYLYRVNLVLDYIENNLDKKLALVELASIANFSQFHFHKVFKSIINENIYDLIKRLRLEKAKSMLNSTLDFNITDISYEVGFSSSSSFSTAFKEYYGITPRQYRNDNGIKLNKKVNSEKEIDLTNNLLSDRDICIVTMPDIDVVYTRQIGDYNHYLKAWHKLMREVSEKELINDKTKYIGIPYDDPSITSVDKRRYDACISVDQGISLTGLGKKTILGGLYCIFDFNDDVNQIRNAYEYIYRKWLPDSGYIPDDKNIFVVHKSSLLVEEGDKIHMDICLPIRKITFTK